MSENEVTDNDKLYRSISPLAFKYATLLYDQMHVHHEEALATEFVHDGYPAEINETITVFRGTLMGVGQEVGLAKSAVNTGAQLLTAMRAITVLRRASRNTQTVVLLSYKPTHEQYEQYRANTQIMSTQISKNRYTIMNDRIKELERRVRNLEDIVDVLTPHRVKR